MSKFGVDVSQVAGASTAVNISVTSIRTEVATMMRNLTDLQGSWTGGAAATFSGVVAQWQVTQTQVESGLDAITAALSRTATTYEDAESMAAGHFAL
ncbi:WXG100 family type VII secretion target [Sanguibacter antarcticus]|uniref:ESAT-6-like protein n=1 Tax=Sanguibacter antarcticus TaxID=372484 RepID=A0A2A9E8N2_9MICO|nr:WXG100 family type VII secretion target [Sanguibacter antarcticus]PFG32201.1 WXG100 family type VII secretion target [Sanguibacter antarcticus]PFG35318.1 WXG100 family type VII secretion target [Sanguibacter antarcticus]